ncbi:MAG: glutamyl-tRNA reductase, partial [Alphaproteobacteria bacterium]|nr:glutamyl-tRNA reductase [Alphaproteobacteria bacterium]
TLSDDCSGPDLDQLMQFAFNLAKRVRHQTKIGEGAVSIASAGVKLAKDLFGDIENLQGHIYGLGEGGHLFQEQFRAAGLNNWRLSGRSRRTERFAAKQNCHFVPENEFSDYLLEADILLTASGLGRFILSSEEFQNLMEKRKFSPLLIIDTAIPQDIVNSVDKIEGIFRYSLEDLERLAERGQTNREKEANAARQMVKDAVIEYRRVLAEKDGIPSLVALREHFDNVRQNVLQENPHLDAIEATRLLVNKLLHRPSEALRLLAGDGKDADFKDWITVNRVLEQLFQISEATSADQQKERGEKE